MYRLDQDLLKDWVKPNSRVLDLGCGDGALLAKLRDEKNVSGLGLEIDTDQITTCLERGLDVIEQNMDEGLSNFQTDSFDTVIMNQALQAVHYPHLVLEEMLRIGKECYITFPNFGHWRCRAYLISNGRMPVSNFMPYTWYDTPNIHFCTVKDFEALCEQKGIKIINKAVVNQNNQTTWQAKKWPNLFAVTAIYHVTR